MTHSDTTGVGPGCGEANSDSQKSRVGKEHDRVLGFELWGITTIWRLSPESNRGTRLCRPLHNHSATQPVRVMVLIIYQLTAITVSNCGQYLFGQGIRLRVFGCGCSGQHSGLGLAACRQGAFQLQIRWELRWYLRVHPVLALHSTVIRVKRWSVQHSCRHRFAQYLHTQITTDAAGS